MLKRHNAMSAHSGIETGHFSKTYQKLRKGLRHKDVKIRRMSIFSDDILYGCHNVTPWCSSMFVDQNGPYFDTFDG